MAIVNRQIDLQNPRIRIRGFGFHFPGEPVAISSLPLTADEAKRLPRLGQETTYISSEDSTALMIHASRDALARNAMAASDLRMFISAPSLMTSYGLEIPAVAIRAALGSTSAQCLNIAQGCVGVLRGIDLAAQMLAAKPDGGDIMVVTSCRASSHTRNMNHGAFFWGDAAAAVILTAAPGPGLEIVSYAEVSNSENWGAMRVAFGDGMDAVLEQDRDDARLIQVEFESAEGQIDYIRGEQRNFAAVVDQLLSSQGLQQGDIEALFLPSTGKNRVPILLSDHRDFLKRMKTDLRYAHFGGVDPIFSLHQHLDRGAPTAGTWQIVASPAFAAQWGGLLFRVLG
jgi:3-oxoacyl-[acyl-carrier-protein] synthase III